MSPSPADATTLARLIEDTRQRISDPPMSLREIGRRAGLSSSRMHQLVHEEMKALPDPDSLRKLAGALHLPLHQVVAAALTSLGLPIPARQERAHVIESAQHLLSFRTPADGDEAALVIANEISDGLRSIAHAAGEGERINWSTLQIHSTNQDEMYDPNDHVLRITVDIVKERPWTSS